MRATENSILAEIAQDPKMRSQFHRIPKTRRRQVLDILLEECAEITDFCYGIFRKAMRKKIQP